MYIPIVQLKLKEKGILQVSEPFSPTKRSINVFDFPFCDKDKKKGLTLPKSSCLFEITNVNFGGFFFYWAGVMRKKGFSRKRTYRKQSTTEVTNERRWKTRSSSLRIKKKSFLQTQHIPGRATQKLLYFFVFISTKNDAKNSEWSVEQMLDVYTSDSNRGR